MTIQIPIKPSQKKIVWIASIKIRTFMKYLLNYS